MNILEDIKKFYKQFLEMQIAKNLAQNTIKIYTMVFEQFYDYLAGEVNDAQVNNLCDVNNSFLAGYIANLKSNDLSDTTRKLHVTILKQFFWFIADSDPKYSILRSKITGIKVKLADKEVEAFSDDEQSKINGLILQLDQSKNFRDHRMSLILKLLLYHGIRVDELINLKWSDVKEVYDDFYGYVYRFKYMGKGSKERDLDFTTSFVAKNFEIIKNHIASDYVVPSSTGKRSFRNSIYLSVRSLLEKQNISKVWLHKFRHTFGQNKVNEGVNSATITELMGHYGPDVTFKFYLRGNRKAKRKAILDGIPSDISRKNKNDK